MTDFQYYGDSGSAGAVLRLQRALVNRFSTYANDADNIEAIYTAYGLLPPTPPPAPRLYDEPPAGVASYWRLGDASTEIETGSGRLLWIVDQEIESHADPVQGRAVALVMSDIVERAFLARQVEIDPMDHPHQGAGLYLDAWAAPDALVLDTDPEDSKGVRQSPIVVIDATQTDSSIGYAASGLTYQIVSTWNFVLSPR